MWKKIILFLRKVLENKVIRHRKEINLNFVGNNQNDVQNLYYF